MPDFGGLGNEQCIKLRNYIWQVCGSTSTEDPAQSRVVQSKKNALVILYKLWSAFTKNIRYIIDSKEKAVTLSRFGTFTRSQADPNKVTFIQSTDLANSLNADTSNEQSQHETTGPEW